MPTPVENFKARLEAFPWGTVQDCFGPATGVPDLLMRLFNTGDHQPVWFDMYTNLVHQGTRYPATMEVIPFLVEMLDLLPEARDRAYMVSFIADVALGDAAAYATVGYHPENNRPRGFCERLHERVEELLIPRMLQWAKQAGNTPERRVALWSLAWFPDSAGKSKPVLNVAKKESGIIGRVPKFALEMLELAEDENFDDEPWNQDERMEEHDKMLWLLISGEGEDGK